MDVKAIQRIRSSPAEFRKVLRIDRADGGVSTLAEASDPWQAEDDAALDNGLCLAAGIPTDPTKPTYQRCYLERARGHAKSSTLAAAISWLLYASPRRIEAIGAAADQEQGGILRNAVARLAGLNSWLGAALDIQQWRVVNRHTESELRIISSDVGSSYGLTPHAIVADELTHWSKPDLWSSLVSSAAKRRDCFMACISNAGLSAGGTSWVWLAREAARQDERWYFRSLPCCASWISQDALAEQERLLPTPAYRRLWLNEWQDGSGDALTSEDIQAACVLPGPPDNSTIVPRAGRPPEFNYEAFIGVDIGVRRDHSAAVCLAAKDGRVELLFVKGWKPHSTLGVDLADVRATVLGVANRYRATVYYDPTQCEALAQDWRAAGITAFPYPFTAANCTTMANTIVSQFRERKVSLFNDADLIRDLGALTIAERPNAHGYKLESRRAADGSHADRAFALAIALVPAARAAQAEPEIDGTELMEWLDEIKTIRRQSAPTLSPQYWQTH